MGSEFSKEFDYSREASDLLESLFIHREEIFLEVYEKALDFVKENRRIYLDEKRSKLQQGKGIRMIRKQLLEKWDRQKLTFFQRSIDIDMHPSQSEYLFYLVERDVRKQIKNLYEEEGRPFDQKLAHEFFRQKPLMPSENDPDFLEYKYISNPEYSLYIDSDPYLVWMGKDEIYIRDDKGKLVRTEDGTDLLTRNTDTYVVVQRFYNGFYWTVSTYEAIDNRNERKNQVIEEMMDVIAQKEGAKTIEQISKELYEYMWLTPLEVRSLLTSAALQYVDRYSNQIEEALKEMDYEKPRSGSVQEKFTNPFYRYFL